MHCQIPRVGRDRGGLAIVKSGAAARHEGYAGGEIARAICVVLPRRRQPGEFATGAKEIEMLRTIVAESCRKNGFLPKLRRKCQSRQLVQHLANRLGARFAIRHADPLPAKAEGGELGVGTWLDFSAEPV